jgi:hypothetical protein
MECLDSRRLRLAAHRRVSLIARAHRALDSVRTTFPVLRPTPTLRDWSTSNVVIARSIRFRNSDDVTSRTPPMPGGHRVDERPPRAIRLRVCLVDFHATPPRPGGTGASRPHRSRTDRHTHCRDGERLELSRRVGNRSAQLEAEPAVTEIGDDALRAAEHGVDAPAGLPARPAPRHPAAPPRPPRAQ